MSLALLAAIWLSACSERAAPTAGQERSRPAGVITLGDVEPDEPATRIRRIQPLADLLGERLADHGIGHGRVVVAHDTAEMARLMRDGEVDLFLDSPFPVLAVNEEAGSGNLLLRQAKDDELYWTEFVVPANSSATRLADLAGLIVTFQEPGSTSGFMLPAIKLIESGFALQAVTRRDSKVDADKVGCIFSGDEENTIELLLDDRAVAGVVSNQDFRELPQATRDRLRIIGSTDPVPRQLVAVRPGMDSDLVTSVRRVLLDLTDADRERMAAEDAPRGWTWRFAPLTAEMESALANISEYVDALPMCATAR